MNPQMASSIVRKSLTQYITILIQTLYLLEIKVYPGSLLLKIYQLQ